MAKQEAYVKYRNKTHIPVLRCTHYCKWYQKIQANKFKDDSRLWKFITIIFIFPSLKKMQPLLLHIIQFSLTVSLIVSLNDNTHTPTKCMGVIQ